MLIIKIKIVFITVFKYNIKNFNWYRLVKHKKETEKTVTFPEQTNKKK